MASQTLQAKRKRDLEQLGQRVAAILATDPLFLDTETTGLDGEVVQVAVVDLAGRVLLDTLVNPLGEISAEAARVHGITAEMVAGARCWREVHPQVQELLEGRTVVAYNVRFDRGAIVHSSRLFRLPAPTPRTWFCAMEAYAVYYGRWSEWHGSYRWQKLEDALRQNDLDGDGVAFHQAAGDAEATRRLVLWMAERLNGAGGTAMLQIEDAIYNAVATAPRNWERAVGYKGDARFVAFYWTPYGDEACYEDGRQSLVGANWPVYLQLADRLPVSLELRYALGSSEEEATHHLLLDRETRQLYVVPKGDSLRFVLRQHPPRPPVAPEQARVVYEEVKRVLAEGEWREEIGYLCLCSNSACLSGWIQAVDGGYDPCPVCEGQGVLAAEGSGE